MREVLLPSSLFILGLSVTAAQAACDLTKGSQGTATQPDGSYRVTTLSAPSSTRITGCMVSIEEHAPNGRLVTSSTMPAPPRPTFANVSVWAPSGALAMTQLFGAAGASEKLSVLAVTTFSKDATWSRSVLTLVPGTTVTAAIDVVGKDGTTTTYRPGAAGRWTEIDQAPDGTVLATAARTGAPPLPAGVPATFLAAGMLWRTTIAATSSAKSG